jgi:hypothetical protein
LGLGLNTSGSGMGLIGALAAVWRVPIGNGRGVSAESALGLIPDTDPA